jgi:ketosteroid isomerase-like protein
MANTQGGSVEERLSRLEDLEEIRRLVQHYRRHLDARDLVAYGLLFARDGEWLGGTGYGRSPAGITAMLNERLPGNSGDSGQASWHLVTEPEIVLDGDRAAGVVTWALVVRGDAGTPFLRLLGRYEDTYVRENGRWRFRRRIAHTDIPRRELVVPSDWKTGEAATSAAGDGAEAPVSADGSVGLRLRRLEDLEQIRQLFIDYKTVLDRKDFSAYAALFAEDGEFVAGPQQAKGRAAIQALVEAMLGNLLGSQVGEDFHVVVNPQVEWDAADPDRARAQSTWLYVVKGDDGGPVLSKLGHYDDELVREGGRWRFLRREAPMDIPAPAAERVT